MIGAVREGFMYRRILLAFIGITILCAAGYATDLFPRFAYVPNKTDHTISIYTVNIYNGRFRQNGYTTVTFNPNAVAVAPSGNFLYSANETGNVQVFTINPSAGNLTPGATIAAGTTTKGIIIHPTGTFLYAANSGSNNVSAYTVDTGTGALTANGAAVAAGTGASSIAITPSGQFVYAANTGTTTVSAYVVQGDGKLAVASGSPFSAGTNPSSVFVHPNGLFLYVTNNASNNVSVFSINGGTGALTPISGSPFSAGTNPKSIALNPAGTLAYVANGGGTVSGYTVDPGTGFLTPIAGTFNAGTSPSAVQVDPTGKFVYVTNSGSNDVSIFEISSTNGALTNSATTRARKAPAGITIAAGNSYVVHKPKFAFAADGTGNGVSAFTVNRTNGALTLVNGSPFNIGLTTNQVATDLWGKFAYVGRLSAPEVSSFTIGTDGALAETTFSPTVASASTKSMAVDPSGRFFYLANFNSQIDIYVINTATGDLTPSGAPLSIGSNPLGMAIDPTGQYLYTANLNSANISAFQINPSGGALSAVPGQPFAAVSGTRALKVHPSGRFLYVANTNNNTISAFSINSSTGALTANGSAVATGLLPSSVAIHPWAQFLYTVDRNSASISGYSIDISTGLLTELPDSPFASSGSNPVQMEIEPSGKFAYVLRLGSGDLEIFSINPNTGALNSVGTAVPPSGTFMNSFALTQAIEFTNPPGALFKDDFEDGNRDGWSFTKGNWTVVNGNLTGTFKKKADITAGNLFAGCSLCSIEADVQVQTAGGRASVLGWFVNGSNMVELAAMDDTNKWQLKVKSNGATVAKKSFAKTIDPNIDYHIILSFDGSALHASVDGVTIINLDTSVALNGTVGFRVKSMDGANKTVSFREIFVQ